MQEDSLSKTEQRLKSPYAGMWCLVCSVACVVLFFPAVWTVAVVVVGYYVYFTDVSPPSVGWVIVVYTFLVMASLGLLFLIRGFIIGGEYTRWLCAFWTLLVPVIIYLRLFG